MRTTTNGKQWSRYDYDTGRQSVLGLLRMEKRHRRPSHRLSKHWPLVLDYAEAAIRVHGLRSLATVFALIESARFWMQVQREEYEDLSTRRPEQRSLPLQQSSQHAHSPATIGQDSADALGPNGCWFAKRLMVLAKEIVLSVMRQCVATPVTDLDPQWFRVEALLDGWLELQTWTLPDTTYSHLK